jgi:hypothetical protein
MKSFAATFHQSVHFFNRKRLNAVGERFGLKSFESHKILKQVLVVVAGWRKTARRLRLSSSTIDSYASAFENPLLEEAQRLIGR